jgi:hypothetical protein
VHTVSHRIGLGRILAEDLTVYAMMQAECPPPSARISVVGSASSGAAFEAMVKSEAKESIGVCVCGWRGAMNLSKSETLFQLLLYLIGLRTYGGCP